MSYVNPFRHTASMARSSTAAQGLSGPPPVTLVTARRSGEVRTRAPRTARVEVVKAALEVYYTIYGYGGTRERFGGLGFLGGGGGFGIWAGGVTVENYSVSGRF